VGEYTVEQVYIQRREKGAHEWMNEFKQNPDDMYAFSKRLDENIQSINSDYEAKRYNNMSLNELILNLAKPNLFHLWLSKKDKLGGQNKIPRLSNDRIYLEQLKELNK